MIEIILDASQIEQFEKCPRAWYYSYLRNLEPKAARKSFDVGSYFHEVLAHYYSISSEKESPYRIASALKFARQPTLLDKFNIKKLEDQQFYVQRLQNYFYRWESEDSVMEVIAVEKGFSRVLYEDSTRRYVLEGKIDLIGVAQGMGLVVMDHKTQSRAGQRWPTNHQLLNYFSFVKPNYFIYNYIGLQDKIVPATFVRQTHQPFGEVLESWENEVMKTFEEMYSYITKHAPNLNLGTIDHELNFPRRRSACDGKYGVCQFHHMCSVSEDSKWRPAVESMYKVKDIKWQAWSAAESDVEST